MSFAQLNRQHPHDHRPHRLQGLELLHHAARRWRRLGYGDYLEQLTYLIFLKMADEYARPPYNRDVGIPAGYGWTSLTTRRGAELEAHYILLLCRLGEYKGMLGQIFTKAQNKITDPAKLYRLIDMVDGTQWVMLGADVKGDIYEGLLERNAEDTKSADPQTAQVWYDDYRTNVHHTLKLSSGCAMLR